MKTAASFALLIFSIVVFLFSCFVTATDGQGALIFIFSGPITACSLVGASLLAQKKSLLRLANQVVAGFILFFFAFAIIPSPLRALPGAVVTGVAKAFESMTGKTPYAWARARNDVLGKIDRELTRTNGLSFDFSKIDTARSWDRVCIFPPYTDNAKVREVLKRDDLDITMYSKVSTSDDVHALVFMDGASTSHIIELSRSKLDFAPLSTPCIERTRAAFVRDEKAPDRNVFVLR